VSEALRGTANAADGVPLAITRFAAQGRAWATMLRAQSIGEIEWAKSPAS